MNVDGGHSGQCHPRGPRVADNITAQQSVQALCHATVVTVIEVSCNCVFTIDTMPVDCDRSRFNQWRFQDFETGGWTGANILSLLSFPSPFLSLSLPLVVGPLLRLEGLETA